MKQEENNINQLMAPDDVERENFKNVGARVTSWIFSNLFAILFPVGAIYFAETFKKDGQFTIQDKYSEMLMVAISICVNLIMQLNTKKYHLRGNTITLIRIVTVASLVISSLAYGASKTIPIENLALDIVFKFSAGICIVTFILGAICEMKKKGRD